MSTLNITAEDFTLKGKVIDEEGNALELVTISCAAQGKVTMSNLKGEFSISLNTADSVEVKLMNGDTVVGNPVTLNERGAWKYTWTKLNKYADGKEIPYTVVETETDVITGTDGPGKKFHTK